MTMALCQVGEVLKQGSKACTQCKSGTFTMNSTASACWSCPPNAKCGPGAFFLPYTGCVVGARGGHPQCVCVCADSLCTVLGVVCRYWVPPDVDPTLQPVVIPCLREGDVFSPALLLLMVAA